jgi:hypothetical protein
VINWYFGASSSTVARVATRRTVGARRATTAGPRARRAPPHGTAAPAVVARGDAEEDASAIDAVHRAPCDRATDAHAGVMRAREWGRREAEKRIGLQCLIHLYKTGAANSRVEVTFYHTFITRSADCGLRENQRRKSALARE